MMRISRPTMHFGGWVHVRAEALDPERCSTRLKNGHYYSSQGPQIHELSLARR